MTTTFSSFTDDIESSTARPGQLWLHQGKHPLVGGNRFTIVKPSTIPGCGGWEVSDFKECFIGYGAPVLVIDIRPQDRGRSAFVVFLFEDNTFWANLAYFEHNFSPASCGHQEKQE